MPVKTGLFFSLFLFGLQAGHIKDFNNDVLSGVRSIKHRHFLQSPRRARETSDAHVSLDWNRHREKRSASLSTGVKVCPRESAAEVSYNHRAYYKLRVCQEAVWEAFQIFLDRLPDTMEYHQWVYACQRGVLCVDDMAQNFSRTQEHLDMVARSMSARDEPKSVLATTVSYKNCSKRPGELSVMESEESAVSAAAPVKSLERVIEFRVSVEDPGYSPPQQDSATLQHRDVIHSLHKQMLQIFGKLPGFKEIRLLGNQCGDGVPQCAKVFEREGSASGTESAHPALKDKLAKALDEDSALPLDSHSLSYEQDCRKHLTDDISTDATEVISERSVENASSSEGDTAPNGTHGRREEETTESTRVGMSTHLTLTTLAASMGRSAPNGVLKVEEPVNGHLITTLTQITEGSKGSTTLDYPSKVSGETSGPQNISSYKAVSVSIPAPPSVEFVMVSEAFHTKGTPSALPSFTPSKIPKDDGTAGATVGSTINPFEAPSSELIEPSNPTENQRFPSISGPEPGEFRSASHTVDSILPRKPPSTTEPLSPAPSALPVTPENALEEGLALQIYTTHPPKNGSDMAMQDVAQRAREERTEAVNPLDYGSRVPSETPKRPWSSALPGESTTPSVMANSQAKELVVCFSLRVTNTNFSLDLFNNSSPEYKSLENTFLELLLPYLQSNLTGFKELKILNLKNGSWVANSKIELVKLVSYNATKSTQCVRNSTSESLENDSPSVNVASGRGDSCKHVDCSEFSRCTVDPRSAEVECTCDPGYGTVDGMSCQSICNLQPQYCLNGGRCEIIPGHGALCRCPVGRFWQYHGEHCNELVSLLADPLLFTACLVGCVIVACALIAILVFLNNKWIRTRKSVTLVHSHSFLPHEGRMRVNPAFENYEGILTHVSSISCPKSSDSGSFQLADQLQSVENTCNSTEIPRQLYARSEMVDFHLCIPNHEAWLSNAHKSSSLHGPESEHLEVTIL